MGRVERGVDGSNEVQVVGAVDRPARIAFVARLGQGDQPVALGASIEERRDVFAVVGIDGFDVGLAQGAGAEDLDVEAPNGLSCRIDK